jgi:hypothetical protein
MEKRQLRRAGAGSGVPPLLGVRVLLLSVHCEPGPPSSVLRSAGAELLTPIGVAEAERCLARIRIDIVLADTDLRDPTGRDAAAIVRAIEGPGPPPAVLGVQYDAPAGIASAVDFDEVLPRAALPSEIIAAMLRLSGPSEE